MLAPGAVVNDGVGRAFTVTALVVADAVQPPGYVTVKVYVPPAAVTDAVNVGLALVDV
jgi:hypothetical protein